MAAAAFWQPALSDAGRCSRHTVDWLLRAAAYRRAIAIRACFAEAWFILGNVLIALGRLEEADAAFRAAVAAEAHYPFRLQTHSWIALRLADQLAEARCERNVA